MKTIDFFVSLDLQFSDYVALEEVLCQIKYVLLGQYALKNEIYYSDSIIKSFMFKMSTNFKLLIYYFSNSE